MQQVRHHCAFAIAFAVDLIYDRETPTTARCHDISLIAQFFPSNSPTFSHSRSISRPQIYCKEIISIKNALVRVFAKGTAKRLDVYQSHFLISQLSKLGLRSRGGRGRTEGREGQTSIDDIAPFIRTNRPREHLRAYVLSRDG